MTSSRPSSPPIISFWSSRRCSRTGSTVLHAAASINDVETVNSILDENFQMISELDENGETPLETALWSSAAEVAAILWAVTPPSQQPRSQPELQRMLLAASFCGLTELIEHCVTCGASPNTPDPTFADATPLGVAAGAGHTGAVSTLLKLGADASLESSGLSPLAHAASFGSEQVVAILLPLSPPASLSQAALEAAAGGHDAALTTLLACGADPDAKDLHGDRCLHWACGCGHHRAVQTLLAAGADPNGSGETGAPLHAAAGAGAAKCCTLLLCAGARLDMLDENGLTPAELALRAGHRQIAALLRVEPKQKQKRRRRRRWPNRRWEQGRLKAKILFFLSATIIFIMLFATKF